MEKSKHISEFKKGDLITRVESVLNDLKRYDEVPGKGFGSDLVFDESYIGSPLEFLGTNENKIYCRIPYEDPMDIELDYTLFQNGWIKYVDPEKPREGSLKSKDVENLVSGLNFN